MAKNWAICIGVNEYDFLQPLTYAQRDAQLMYEFLTKEAGFERVLLFFTHAPQRNRRPSRANLRRAIRQLVKDAKMAAGDNFWFFFSGHGMRSNGRDYLMPADGDREEVDHSAIPINWITDQLRECGADNVVLFLDACRNQEDKGGEGIGEETAEKAKQTGAISFFSCSPNEYSYEITALRRGAFTCALLEGLGIQGQCATVERLNHYLTHRVPELLRQHRSEKDRQTPYTIAEPIAKSYLILLPQYATQADIERLKYHACQAEVEGKLQQAWQLWIRVNVAAMGTDMDAIRAFQRIPSLSQNIPAVERIETFTATNKDDFIPQIDPFPSPTKKGDASPPTKSKEDKGKPLQTFTFEVITVDRRGQITERKPGQAEYFEEDLGNGVKLEMVKIPGGTFWMGSLEGEGHYNEKPQHKVTVPPFFMGKYPITQAQYSAIMGKNPSYFKGDKRPVEQVSWSDAVEFCEKLSQKTGWEYRLPSEAEWEYACKSVISESSGKPIYPPFHFGATLTDKLANYCASATFADESKGEYRQQTTDVGSFPPNAFGLYDMHGNVWEWCTDPWHDNYQGAPDGSSTWLKNGHENYSSLRGGSWKLYANDCRSACRDRFIRVGRVHFSNIFGFRVVVCGFQRIPTLLQSSLTLESPEILPTLKEVDVISQIRTSSTTMEKGDVTLSNPSEEENGKSLQIFTFEVITVDKRGQIIEKKPGQAEYFEEDLGNGVKLEMVKIPGGTFWMGTEDEEIERLCKKYDVEYFRAERHQHKVTVSPVFMGKFPITQTQYNAIMGKNPSHFKGHKRPVEQVSWYDAVEFCEKLSQKTGWEYRLPSEAEWEYACKSVVSHQSSVISESSGKPTYPPFHFGETLTDKLANYDASETFADELKGEYRKQTTEVGNFPPNAFGLYDMHGNVWEWCADTWHGTYEGTPTDGSVWIERENDNRYCFIRGGSWNGDLRYCRSAYRDNDSPDGRYFDLGFRVARSAPMTP
ncbi:SUMF1/EgtB/PvdO family nonheme iron enzyme [Lusitaniella coriacea]|uniref:SUMF1/EgtB/PvdO family nonheme iron enzyme n=1 Tax=Lusitaniella coriacea TaxID=1983105 RepID=UPI003CE90E5F